MEMENLRGFVPSGFFIDDPLCPPSPTTISPLLSNPSPQSIPHNSWNKAENHTLNILRLIHPTFSSHQKRLDIIHFMQEFIHINLGIKVFAFGSVPLKTYLPDGDIDLTAVVVPMYEDSFVKDVHSLLKWAEKNKDNYFEVKDVQLVKAEVKIIKCLVQNIAVDISFNKLGGLCTLCFIEKVDRFIGKDHLFKRSIILIKAWCYYESRILGAHHGLISTYALETMVLYVFHLFHSTFDGPLSVLYRFLDYYSKFDWNSYCISLHGPVPISSLPKIAAETPENDGGELLLEKEFMRDCIEQFADPSRDLDLNLKSFPQKNFNIVDPLKEYNNLGRSVNIGNLFRIRSAFAYGAHKLGQILLLQVDDVWDELNKFFMNTLERHGSRQRPDVPVVLSANGLTSAAEEGPAENGSHMRPSSGLISSWEMRESLGYINGKVGISAGPLLCDSSKLVTNTKVDSCGGDGDGSSGSSTLGSDGVSVENVEALPDLGGDFDSLMNSLNCARTYYGELYKQFHQITPYSHAMHQKPRYMRTANGLSHMNAVYQGPYYYQQVHPGYGVDESTSRQRGTGAYLPNPPNGGASYR